MVLKLKPGTRLLWAVALTMALGVVAWEMGRHSQNQATVIESQPKARHFDFGADLVQSVTITRSDPTPTNVKIYRQSKANHGKSVWLMDNPDPVAVSTPGVDFLLSVILGSQNGRDFEVPTVELKDYGLSPAEIELTIQLVNGKTHRLQLGNPDFAGDSLYALVDPVENADIPVEKQKVSLVPRSLEELTRRSPTDWQQADLETDSQNGENQDGDGSEGGVSSESLER
ncbi:hypothetical protein IQE94_02355 [Synechocystis sp. PCC 7339]|uniref:DUF4340 domain-containing protein n=1 Tax=Synechocystis sp. PCC 7339 TaxID=2782213 RepID=UPI001CBC714D|nr:DUF4340 domain-containing protein [Synechocystis sp. PCC 7339]UAJ73203.1 hypothetical protein IQE94_02355 [Synechocystis sp. PCC 7339]